jgi:hypothetical protein
MKLFNERILLIALVAAFFWSAEAFAQTNSESVEAFLPKVTVTNAWYVVIEPDPAFDDYGRRFRAAREKNPEWFAEYSRKHQGTDSAPYDEHFGVSKEEYEHFREPMNQFREARRQEIRVQRTEQKRLVGFNFQGNALLLTNLVVNLEETTAKTLLDLLPKQGFVDLKKASLPPGPHRGVLFRTPDAKIAANKRRESLLIGEVKDKNSGIIHYSINTPGQVKMIYIQFAK